MRQTSVFFFSTGYQMSISSTLLPQRGSSPRTEPQPQPSSLPVLNSCCKQKSSEHPVVLSLSLVQLFCDSMDNNPPGSSVRGIFQARKLEWIAMPSSRGSSRPRFDLHLLCLLPWQAASLPLGLSGKSLKAPQGLPNIQVF